MPLKQLEFSTRCLINKRASPSGRNVSPHCGCAGEHYWLSLSLFFPPAWFPFGLFQFHPLLLTGKVKQEPSVYRDGPPYQRRGSLQLWQFLVTLLDDPANGHFIAWTGRGMEFKLIEPEEVSPRLCAALPTSFVTFVIYSLYLSLVVCRWLVAGASKRTDLPWTTTSWAAHCVITMRRASCRR